MHEESIIHQLAPYVPGFIIAILVTIAGFTGYSNQKRAGWILIIISGVLEVLSALVSFSVRRAIPIEEYIVFSYVLRVVYFIAGACLAAGLFMLASRPRKRPGAAVVTEQNSSAFPRR